MVKVNGPMMSLDASGSLANAITFSKWKGRNYVRERVTPSNPKSGGQTGRRAMFKYLSQIWSTLGTSNQATWDSLGDDLIASSFNGMVSSEMKNWHNFIAPRRAATDLRVGTTGDVIIDAAVWEENRVKVTMLGTDEQDNQGIIVFASVGAAFTPAVGNVIFVEPHEVATSTDFFWTPPNVTTWYFNSMQFTQDGVISAAGGEDSAAPP